MNGLLLLWLAAPGSAASTAPAVRQSPPLENPWSLSYGVDRRGERYGRLDYRLRWSLEDLRAAPRALERELARPARSVEGTLRGLLQGSRFEYHGLRVRPFRDLPLLPPESDFAREASSGTASPPTAARHGAVSWRAVYEDLQEGARREAQRFLIREGFDRALPEHRDAPYGQKKALSEGLLDLGRSWGADGSDR